VSHAERQRVDDVTWGELERLGLVRAGEHAHFVTCPSCGEDEDVTWLEGPGRRAPRPFVLCERFGAHRIEELLLERFDVDVSRLATMLSAGLGIVGSVECVLPSVLWHLGRLALGRTRREVFLARRLRDAGVLEALSACPRFAHAHAPLVLVAGALPDEPPWQGERGTLLGVDGVVRLADGRVTVDRAYVEGVLGVRVARGPAPRHVRFETPAGARWHDVQLHFLDTETLSVRVLGRTGVFTYAEMGMADRRTGRPSVQWELLRVLAGVNGTLTWSEGTARHAYKKRCSRLVEDLQRVFGIETGVPIEYSHSDHGWRVAIQISE
jgi:hypothetical protein